MKEVANTLLLLGLKVTDLDGESHSLESAVSQGPLVVCVGMPRVHASRLVIGYLRRLKEQQPEAQIWVVLQGESDDVTAYCDGYLSDLVTIHDADLSISEQLDASHVPSTYVFTQEAGAIRLESSFTGFKRFTMNALATRMAEATGAKAKELIAANDNKGEYELAERGLW